MSSTTALTTGNPTATSTSGNQNGIQMPMSAASLFLFAILAAAGLLMLIVSIVSIRYLLLRSQRRHFQEALLAGAWLEPSISKDQVAQRPFMYDTYLSGGSIEDMRADWRAEKRWSDMMPLSATSYPTEGKNEPVVQPSAHLGPSPSGRVSFLSNRIRWWRTLRLRQDPQVLPRPSSISPRQPPSVDSSLTRTASSPATRSSVSSSPRTETLSHVDSHPVEGSLPDSASLRLTVLIAMPSSSPLPTAQDASEKPNKDASHPHLPRLELGITDVPLCDV